MTMRGIGVGNHIGSRGMVMLAAILEVLMIMMSEITIRFPVIKSC